VAGRPSRLPDRATAVVAPPSQAPTADLPNGTAVTTSNEASGSGLRAIALAADRLEAGRADVAIGGGFDSMILDSLWVVNLDVHMGEITERLVDREGDRYDLSRATQDRYAHESHRWAADAIDDGPFDEEIVPVETPEGSVERDEGPRPESTVEDLGALPTAFREDRTITAGNASKLSDGAGAAITALLSAP